MSAAPLALNTNIALRCPDGAARRCCLPEAHGASQSKKPTCQFCYQRLAEYLSTTLLFWIKETGPCGDLRFQIRDLQVAYRFNASNFTTSTTQ